MVFRQTGPNRIDPSVWEVKWTKLSTEDLSKEESRLTEILSKGIPNRSLKAQLDQMLQAIQRRIYIRDTEKSEAEEEKEKRKARWGL
jgi:hypothetical protein